MVRITEELVRKKSEHNEGIIGTLEELSLHQEDIDKIEHINNWCKNIQILYLQSNLIPKIENLNKLKHLEYLNLAINNIEKIENLERCEFLEKLDLTLNFIGDLESVCTLQNNIHLKHLYLTGNPCCDFPNYRAYVIAQLPQLVTLDGTEITRSERIKAQQNFKTAELEVMQSQEEYREFREQQKLRAQYNDNSHLTDEEFWKSNSEHCPEGRVEISKRQRKGKDEEKPEKRKKMVTYFTKSGRPLNINQAKIDFTFNDEDPEKFILDVKIYKYLDTNHVQIDLQPIYVRLTIKGKIFQFVFPEEVLVDKSTAKRSETTGHLLLELFKANYKPLAKRKVSSKEKKIVENQNFLEVPEKGDEMDFSKIVENSKKKFDDNPDVPPLEYA